MDRIKNPFKATKTAVIDPITVGDNVYDTSSADVTVSAVANYDTAVIDRYK